MLFMLSAQRDGNRQTVGLAVRIFPATIRTFRKDTALSENGRGAAWYVWINTARHGRGTAWYVWINTARHGRGTACSRRGMCELALRWNWFS
jgi:hypothetical protein